jgi:hypothetical protein
MWNKHKIWEMFWGTLMFLGTLIEHFGFVEGKAQLKVC